MIATEDQTVGSDEARRRGAERAGAQVEILEGLAHWWMLQDPARGAQVLVEFWDALATHGVPKLEQSPRRTLPA